MCKYWSNPSHQNIYVKKILIVEDDHIVQKIHTIYLEKLGYEVEIADTGYAALNLYQQKRYVAILLDIGLIDISGEKVLEKIRDYEKNTKIYTPIIIATAHGLQQERVVYLHKGADAYLRKPISKEQLGAILSTLTQEVE